MNRGRGHRNTTITAETWRKWEEEWEWEEGREVGKKGGRKEKRQKKDCDFKLPQIHFLSKL